MKKRFGFGIFALALMGSGCTPSSFTDGGVLTYEMQREVFDEDVHCDYTMQYPVFSGRNAQRVNENIAQYAGKDIFATKVQDCTKNIADMLADDRFDPESATLLWYSWQTAQVQRHDSDVLSVTFFEESYSGGAHGSHATSAVTIDPKTGKIFSEDQFFVPGGKQELAKEVAKRIVLAHEGDVFDPDVFSGFLKNPTDEGAEKVLEGSIIFYTEDGVTVLYNEYAIAPYAAGPIRLDFLSTDLRSAMQFL